MTRIRFVTTLMMVVFVAILIAIPQGTIFAASRNTQHAFIPTVSCSGYDCDGQNPIATGCSLDAYPARQKIIYDDWGNPIGEVDLKFSPTCGTNWTYVKSYIGPDELEGTVYRVTPYPQSESFAILLDSVDCTRTWCMLLHRIQRMLVE